jgi:hypothetical protein
MKLTAASPSLVVDVYLLECHKEVSLAMKAKVSASCMWMPQDRKVESEQLLSDRSGSRPLTEPTANMVYIPVVSDWSEMKMVTSPDALVAVPPLAAMVTVYTEYEARTVPHNDRNRRCTDGTSMI